MQAQAGKYGDDLQLREQAPGELLPTLTLTLTLTLALALTLTLTLTPTLTRL